MVEEGFRLHIFADFSGIIQLELGDHVDDFMHFVRILVEINQTVLDFQQVVALLKYARREIRGYKLLGAVDFLCHFNERLPFLRIVNHVRHLYIVAPVLDVLDDDFVRGMHREGTRGIFGVGFGNTPGIYHIHLALGGVRISLSEG